jgi:hypothetical protein
MRRGFRFIEKTGVKNRLERNVTEVSLDLASLGIECGDYLANFRERRLCRI